MYSNRKTLPPEIRRSLSEPEIQAFVSSSSGSGFQQNVRFGPPPDEQASEEKQSHRPPSSRQKKHAFHPPNPMPQETITPRTASSQEQDEWEFSWNPITLGALIVSTGMVLFFCLLDIYILFANI